MNSDACSLLATFSRFLFRKGDLTRLPRPSVGCVCSVNRFQDTLKTNSPRYSYQCTAATSLAWSQRRRQSCPFCLAIEQSRRSSWRAMSLARRNRPSSKTHIFDLEQMFIGSNHFLGLHSVCNLLTCGGLLVYPVSAEQSAQLLTLQVTNDGLYLVSAIAQTLDDLHTCLMIVLSTRSRVNMI